MCASRWRQICTLDVIVIERGQNETSDIKFPLIVKKRPFYVLLNNIGLFDAVAVQLFLIHRGSDLIVLLHHLYSCAAVGPLPWLYDPYIH